MKTKSLVLLLFVSLAFNGFSQWEQKSSGFYPTISFRNISMVSEEIIWANPKDSDGNGDLKFSKSIDGGENFVKGVYVGVSNSINVSMLLGMSADVAYMVGVGDNSGGKAVFKTVNGGSLWTNQPTALFSGGDAFCSFIYFFDDNNGVCVGDPNGGSFEHYTTVDAGENWVRSTSVPAYLENEWGTLGNNSHCAIGNTIWYGTSQGRVLKSIDKGVSWTSDTTGLVRADIIEFKDANNGLVMCTADNTIASTVDGGITWNIIPVYPFEEDKKYPAHLRYVADTLNAYFCVGDGSAYSVDGITWTQVDTISFGCMDEYNGRIMAGGEYGGLYKLKGETVSNVKNQKLISNEPLVFPNPARGTLNVNLLGDFSNTTISLFSVTGELVYSKDVSDSLNKIDTDKLPKGVYILSVEQNTQINNTKIIVE